MVRKPELWLKCIKLHVDNGVPMTKLAEQYNLDLSKLKYKVMVYLKFGESPFTDEQEKRIYTREAIHKWIKYYNEERIVVALKTSPLKYRMMKSLNSV